MSLSAFPDIDHFGLALYGFKPETCPIQVVYQWAIDTLAVFGCQPQLADANIGGKKSGNYRSFRWVDRNLRSSGFAGVTNWCCRSDPDDLVGAADVHHGSELMTISYNNEQSSNYLVLTIREEMVRDRMNLLLETIRKACVLLAPVYGIGYRKKSSCLPDLFGMGMQGGGDRDPSCANLPYWNLLTQHNVYWLLRDVFPWNFLTSTQLNVKVDNDRLQDWVRSNPEHGLLSPLTDQITLWTVADDKIPMVRDKLNRVGVILDRLRDFESKMNEYHVGEAVIIESLKLGLPLVHQPLGLLSEDELVKDVLNRMGTTDSTVLIKSDSGKLLELTNNESDGTTTVENGA